MHGDSFGNTEWLELLRGQEPTIVHVMSHVTEYQSQLTNPFDMIFQGIFSANPREDLNHLTK